MAVPGCNPCHTPRRVRSTTHLKRYVKKSRKRECSALAASFCQQYCYLAPGVTNVGNEPTHTGSSMFLGPMYLSKYFLSFYTSTAAYLAGKTPEKMSGPQRGAKCRFFSGALDLETTRRGNDDPGMLHLWPGSSFPLKIGFESGSPASSDLGVEKGS